MADAKDAKELCSVATTKEITQPDIPPEVKEVRVMSLNKSKGLSSPYVFHRAVPCRVCCRRSRRTARRRCVIDARLEEARRLFFVGITHVKAGGNHAGSLYLTYPREMGANTAKGLSIPFRKNVNGRAQLTPSTFIQELGTKAPAPVAGNV